MLKDDKAFEVGSSGNKREYKILKRPGRLDSRSCGSYDKEKSSACCCRECRSPLGFTMVTNNMYDFSHEYPPLQVDVPTQSQTVHIPISSEIHIMHKNLNIHIDEMDPQFKRNVPNIQSACLMTKMEHSKLLKS